MYHFGNKGKVCHFHENNEDFSCFFFFWVGGGGVKESYSLNKVITYIQIITRGASCKDKTKPGAHKNLTKYIIQGMVE